jgi:nucleotide-binding universal stress UspA family protein
MNYQTILVGTDGSESSFRAVERASRLAATEQALVILVCAHHAMTAREQAIVGRTLGDIRFDQVAGADVAEKALAAATRHAHNAGATRVEARLVEGDPAQALLSVAEEASGDLIVVGNRGINSLSGRLLGSVPADVSQRSSCDVLIVHTTQGGRS